MRNKAKKASKKQNRNDEITFLEGKKFVIDKREDVRTKYTQLIREHHNHEAGNDDETRPATIQHMSPAQKAANLLFGGSNESEEEDSPPKAGTEKGDSKPPAKDSETESSNQEE